MLGIFKVKVFAYNWLLRYNETVNKNYCLQLTKLEKLLSENCLSFSFCALVINLKRFDYFGVLYSKSTKMQDFKKLFDIKGYLGYKDLVDDKVLFIITNFIFNLESDKSGLSSFILFYDLLNLLSENNLEKKVLSELIVFADMIKEGKENEN